MSDDAPTRPASEGHGGTPTAVEALLASWVAASESGQTPRLAEFLARLPSQQQREQFVDLLDQLAFADRHMPLRLRPSLLLASRYELLESIGSGGMGQVWRALDRSLGREVAVKVLDLASAAALDLDHLVARESRLLARLSHPGIVRVHDVGRDGEHRFLVMDLVRGVALDDVVAAARRWRESNRTPYDVRDLLERTGPPAPGAAPLLRGGEPWSRAAVSVVVELLRTLEAAHAAGIVHRDIKPANVRLSGGAAPVLLDFGIGVATGSTPGALTAGLFGTAQYAAPEQWADVGAPGVPTDVYQTGLVLYELLTLRRCFSSSNPMETMRAVRTATYAKPRAIDPGIEPALEACVLRAMEVEPAQRYRSAADFRADLEAFLAGQVPRAAAATARLGQRVRAFVRRRRRLLSLAAAMLAGAMALWALQPSPSPTVRWVTATSASVTVGDPAMMAAFRIAYDANGACWCAPLRLDSGPEQPEQLSFGHAVPAGTTDVSLRDVADPTRYARSVVSTVLVDAADERARRRFDAFVGAMEVARRTIADRDGEWLSEAEFRALFAPGRGSGAADVPIDRLFVTGAWQDGDLVGAVVAPPPSPTARNAALLVGIDRYAPAADGPRCADLGGPRNDVARVQRTLQERFGFAAADIHVLTGAEATHANVVRAFHEHLIRGATAESRVVFWFSGHGSRVPDASGRDRAVRDADPFDDTLLLYDSRSVASHGGFDFTDDELASLLAAVPAQDVLVVTDCCHSGGVLRGGSEPGTREAGIGTEPLDRKRVESFWPADVPLLDDDAHGELPAVVHVAACGSEEQAGEIATPAGTFGTLTWFLTNTLQEIDTAASWELVGARVRARVSGHGTRPGQRVAVLGDVGRAIFGGRGRPVAPGYLVDRYGASGLLLAAGAIQGFAEGAEVRLVDLDGRELGTAVAENVRTSTARLHWQGAGPCRAKRCAPSRRPRVVRDRRSGCASSRASTLPSCAGATPRRSNPSVRPRRTC